MDAATEFDVGPLAWVKGEIDLSLDRAGESLRQYIESGELAQLRSCRTHLHQVSGALIIVGLDGIARICSALESLLEDVENEKCSVGAPELVDVGERTLQALRLYLDHLLLAGQPDRPLQLLPLYREIGQLQGHRRISPTDLFFPDLSFRPPQRSTPVPDYSAEELKQILRKERGRFQRGLLSWLHGTRKGDNTRTATLEMREAIRRIEATQEQPGARAFWWVVLGFLSALAEGALRTDTDIDIGYFCSRIDLQIRRLLDGSKNVAERLMRDALFLVARAAANGSKEPQVHTITKIYHLKDSIPTESTATTTSQQELQRRMREALALTEEAWSKFCTGTGKALPQFHTHAASLFLIAEQLGHTDFRRLAQAIGAVASWLGERPTRYSEAVGMEVATAILLAHNAQDNFGSLSLDFAHQVDVMVARIHACIAGTPPVSDSGATILDEISQQAHEKMLMAQVAREILNNLGQIEQILDAFFRDPEKRENLPALDLLIDQVIGALVMLGENYAATQLRDCAERIRHFSDPDYQPNEADFVHIADQLSALGFFIGEMQHGASNFEEFLNLTSRRDRAKGTDSAEEGEAQEAFGSVEAELEKTKHEARALFEAIKEQPHDPQLREDLKQNLENLRKDADLIADSMLGLHAQAALSALSSFEETPDAAPKIEKAIVEGFKTPAIVTPSEETLQLSQASTEDLDAELLSIFIEEAKEVLETIVQSEEELRESPDDTEALTTVRRSYHTLKGSGRMVGLKDLGETAWAVEQVLNLWLREERTPTPELLQLIGSARAVFSAWVEHLESGHPLPDTREVVARAASMLQGTSVPKPQVVPAAPPPVASPEDTIIVVPSEDPERTFIMNVLDGPIHDIPSSIEETVIFDLEATDILSAVPKPDVPGLPVELAPFIEASEFEESRSDQKSDTSRKTGQEAAAPDIALESSLIDGGIESISILEDSQPETINVVEISDSTGDALAEQEPESITVGFDEPESADFGLTSDTQALEQAPASMPADEMVAEETPAVEEIAAAEEPSAETLPEASGKPLELNVSPVLFNIFLEEAWQHLATLHHEFGNFEIDPEQPTTHAITRAAHTLGGTSGTVGILDIRHLAIALENALLRRDESLAPDSPEDLEVVGKVIFALEAMVTSVSKQYEPQAQPELIDALGRIYPRPPQQKETPAEPADSAFRLPQPESTSPPVTEAVASDYAPEVEIISPVAPGASALPASPLKDEIDEQLLPIFLEEAEDLCSGITEHLRKWRQHPDDIEISRVLHRQLHTLKGSARMTGAMNLGALTHAIEAKVEQAQHTGKPAPELIDDIENAFDTVVQIIDFLANGEPFEAGLPTTPLAAADISAEPVPETVLREEEPLGEETPFEPEATGISVPEETPAIPVEAPLAAAAISAPITVAPKISPSVIPSTAKTIVLPADDSDESVTQQHNLLRVRADLLDRLVNDAGELAITRSRVEGEMRSLRESALNLTENVIRLRHQLREVEIQAESQMQSRHAHAEETHLEFDPLEFDRFTRFQELTRMMAEAVNDVAMVEHNLLRSLDETNAALLAQARMNRELQQELMNIRMVPFASQVDRLYRLVRQTSKELKKRANLDIRGDQLEIDRGVLDKVIPPLEHMLRNAVAHGIESREERLAAGKPEIGEITLLLLQEGNEMILSLSDDGAGIDFERIRARGIEAGLISDTDTIDQSILVELIFRPGISAAKEISQISGRGIGMDVVRTAVTSLGGRIEISSTRGQGSTFRFYIPLTLAVTQALLIQAGANMYALPSAMIEQIREIKASELAQIQEIGETEWHGNHYPYHFLPHLLGELNTLPETHNLYWVLYLRSGNQRVAVHVDTLHGNQEIVVKNIGPQLSRVVGIAGATVLGDGRVILILNPVALASRAPSLMLIAAEASLPTPARGVMEAPKAVTQPTIMVVDDSLTVRKITGRLLARHGYQVLTAKDGVDALEQLLDIVPDVMLVDIEMPRMDGFDLTRNIRSDQRLKDIPIIMITSRTAEKHRTYAFEIGVNHYLGKPYQEDELVHLVSGYVKSRRPS
ncbi:MAG: Hpt domain-containing protein [Betaproteobacteria bacterium]|nr:Hpt domain-containing protein [Betaproteobacteria bacterium]